MNKSKRVEKAIDEILEVVDTVEFMYYDCKRLNYEERELLYNDLMERSLCVFHCQEYLTISTNWEAIE